MIIDDFGVEILATAFEVKYSKPHVDKIRQAWDQRQQPTDPRKPIYLLVQKPHTANELPQVLAACGGQEHPPKFAPDSIV